MFSKDNEWVQKNHKEIETIAYFMWQAAGKPDNKDKYFWEMAEDALWEKQHPEEVIEITYPRKKKRHNIVWDYDGTMIVGGSY